MLSKYLLGFLKSNEITKAQFARAMGVTPSAASYWISGKRIPQNKYLDRLVNYISDSSGQKYRSVLLAVMECIMQDSKVTP